MLQSLSIRNVVLIDRLDLGFRPGLNVLTGETGAGKSILLDALGLALGARGDSALVRTGAAQASVSASFDLDPRHPVFALLDEQGLASEPPLILRRSVASDGRSRGFINDQPATIGLLRDVGEMLVEIHGQFDTHGLLDPATHRAALDAFGDLGARADAVAAAWRGWSEAQARAREAAEAAALARRDEEFLRHALAELEQLDPQPGEEAQLAERRAMLAAREKLAEALNAAAAELSAGRGVEHGLRAAQRQLERIADKAMGRLDAAIAALDRAAIEAAEAVGQVQALGASLDGDAAGLEQAEERLFALRALARKHRVEVEALPALRAEIAGKLAALDDSGAGLAALERAGDSARAVYVDAAAALSEARAQAAAKLDRAILRELPPLKLEKAKFRTSLYPLDEADWGPQGAERVAFTVATNPGAQPGPLARIASGGELARFMLALKVVLARTGAATTLVFDEVDAGIGGAAAAAVGERLAKLARGVQVLVVTHSPQVAARGAHHWRVAKRSAAAGVVTAVEPLDATARREEIARLLSGARVTDAARAAADSLIEAARA